MFPFLKLETIWFNLQYLIFNLQWRLRMIFFTKRYKPFHIFMLAHRPQNNFHNFHNCWRKCTSCWHSAEMVWKIIIIGKTKQICEIMKLLNSQMKIKLNCVCNFTKSVYPLCWFGSHHAPAQFHAKSWQLMKPKCNLQMK